MTAMTHDSPTDHASTRDGGLPLSLGEASAYCERLAKTHYENFTVASLLLPKRLRPDFYHIYAYCRTADDLADESASPEEATQKLDAWESELEACYAGQARHPVFTALAETIRRYDIPITPFRDLISAFRQDQSVTRYANHDDVLDYCRRSANPVGRLVLHLARCLDEESLRLSDSVCTGLQLANFCQDVPNDFMRERIYLPRESLERFGYSEEMLASRTHNAAFRQLLGYEVERARRYLESGRPLVGRVPRDLRVDVALFIEGGLAILNEIGRRDYNVWASRPKVSKWRQLALLAKCYCRTRFGRQRHSRV
jgi:squalene synthase HpnC